MAVGVAAPAAIGHAAEAIGGGDGDGDGGAAPLEVAGKEVPPVEADGEGAPPPVEGVPAAITAGGEEEEEKEEVEGEAEEEVKWLGHYSSMQSILIVGDGDFSFSLALATAFGSGANLVATSLDTYEALRGKYSKAESNITGLKRLGATVLHGVDAKKMKLHTDLKNRRFDRIVFNFPHAGFKGKEDDMHMINLHKELVWGFFHNALHLLRPYGEIHVSHKMGWAYDRWDLELLAFKSSLVLVEKVAFQKEDYPGYNQKRGDSARCDEPFDLGTCFTFKFRIRGLKKQRKLNGNRTSSISSLGIMASATDRGTFHRFQPVEAWPQQHFPPPVNTVHMPIILEPSGVAQRQHPGFPLNFDGTVRDPYFHQQGADRLMLSIPGPSFNALPAPGSIPSPMGRVPCPDLLEPQEEPWYHQRISADQVGRDNYFHVWEHQRSLQREYGMQRQVMPGATSLNHSAFLEHRHRYRESVQKQEWLRRMIALYGRQ